MPDNPAAAPGARILFRSPNWLGDAVMALPAMRAIAAANPGASACVICKKGLGDLFGRYDFIDDVVEFSPDESRSVHKSLYARNFDAAYLFTNSFRSAWDARKTGARRIVGFTGQFRGFLLSERVAKPDPSHMVDYYLALAPEVYRTSPHRSIGFPLREEEKEFAASQGGIDGAVGIPLGARYGPAKCWPLDLLASFARLVAERTGRKLVLFGTEAERPQADAIAAAVPGNVVDLVGKTTIGRMAAVMARCGVLVANDSGPLHVAAATGVKVIALFGSTDPKRTAPLGDNITVIMKDSECSPCFKRECPIDFHCMKDISPVEVVEAVQGALKKGG